MMSTLAQGLLPTFAVQGLAVAGAAAMSVPIIIHILSKRPRKPQVWAAMQFLLAAYKRHKMRTRLEQWILLATRCLILLLLGCALAGPVWSQVAAWSGLARSGRVVVLVLDNGLTSGSADATGRSRFERLKATAMQITDALEEGDRVALIRTARPARAIVAPASSDPRAVRRQIEQMTPSPAASNLPAALHETLAVLDEVEDPAARKYVVLLSDFSAGSVALGEAPVLPKKLAELGDKATLLMAEPAPAAENVQIASLTPERSVVLAQSAGETPTVTWTLTVRRFSSALRDGAISTVRLDVPELKVAAEQEQIVWKAGETERTLAFSTALSEVGQISATASLDPGAADEDVLETDNRAHALVRVRQKLNVLVVGRDEVDAGGLTPAIWLQTALAPVSDRLGWPIAVTRISAAELDEPMLDDADAVIIVRPDRLSETTWASLAAWTQEGGLAWFAAPARGQATLWPQKLTAAFGLPWAFKEQPVEYDQPLRLKLDGDVAAELSRLRADLPNLLRPIEVDRRLEIAPDSLGAQSEVLLAGAAGEPLLIAADTAEGRGRVVLLALAFDATWSNFVAKPLFPALMQEMMRAAIDRLNPSNLYEPGDRPLLTGTWTELAGLRDPTGKNIPVARVEAGAELPTADDRPDAPTNGEPGGSNGATNGAARTAGVVPWEPFDQVGIYRSEANALAVNVRAEAGDTRAVPSAALSGWLGSAGEWQTFKPDQAVAMVTQQADRADFGWPLLWVVLVLAIFEMFFARHVSRASSRGRVESVMQMQPQRAA